jgi:hypothetical protein
MENAEAGDVSAVRQSESAPQFTRSRTSIASEDSRHVALIRKTGVRRNLRDPAVRKCQFFASEFHPEPLEVFSGSFAGNAPEYSREMNWMYARFRC